MLRVTGVTSCKEFDFFFSHQFTKYFPNILLDQHDVWQMCDGGLFSSWSVVILALHATLNVVLDPFVMLLMRSWSHFYFTGVPKT